MSQKTGAVSQHRIGPLTVSPVTLGCWTFGRTLSREESADVVHAAIDAGVTTFDVADGYGKGQAEVFLGAAIQGRRDQVVVATKFGSARGHGHRTARGHRANSGGGEPAYIRERLEQSLTRMGITHVDLLQMHDPDPDTPIEETLGELEALRVEGKIRAYGCSNYTSEQLRAAAAAAGEHSFTGFASVQNQYSVLHQLPRAGVLQACDELGMALLPYFPLANGVLTGKYTDRVAVPRDSRLGVFRHEDREDKLRRFLNPVTQARVEALTVYSAQHGHTLLELALGWLLSQPAVPTVLAGARTGEQVAANAAATAWRLTDEELAQVDTLLNDGHELVCEDLGAS